MAERRPVTQRFEQGRIVRREVLDHVERGLLADLLRPFASFFSQHQVDLDAFARTEQEDRGLVDRIYELLHDEGLLEPVPEELVDILSALDTLATRDAAAALVARDRGGVLPKGTHGDDSLAAHAILHHPDLAALVAAETAREAEHKFAEFAPSAVGPALSFLKPTLDKLKSVLGERLDALDHSRYCEVRVSKNRYYVELEIGHGTRPQTRDTIDPRTLAVRQITDVTARRAFARLERRSGWLSVKAYPKVRECIRQSVGEVLAGDREHFRVEGLYDLGPFKDLATVLAPEPPIKAIELRLIGLLTPDRVSLVYRRALRDLMTSDARPIVEASVRVASPNWVRVYLDVEGRRRPIRLELMTDEKRNVVDFNRDDPDVRRIVEGYLEGRRILVHPRRGAEPVSERGGAS